MLIVSIPIKTINLNNEETDRVSKGSYCTKIGGPMHSVNQSGPKELGNCTMKGSHLKTWSNMVKIVKAK